MKSFGKCLKLEKKDSDRFISYMNEPTPPLISSNFKSHYASVASDYKLFEKALS